MRFGSHIRDVLLSPRRKGNKVGGIGLGVTIDGCTRFNGIRRRRVVEVLLQSLDPRITDSGSHRGKNVTRSTTFNFDTVIFCGRRRINIFAFRQINPQSRFMGVFGPDISEMSSMCFHCNLSRLTYTRKGKVQPGHTNA